VVPTRPVPRISDLTSDELKSLMESVKTVGTVVEKAYNGDGLTVACQVRGSIFLSSKTFELIIRRQ
jgi:bis(5'-adenosyl)-triphosphatase